MKQVSGGSVRTPVSAEDKRITGECAEFNGLTVEWKEGGEARFDRDANVNQAVRAVYLAHAAQVITRRVMEQYGLEMLPARKMVVGVSPFINGAAALDVKMDLVIKEFGYMLLNQALEQARAQPAADKWVTVANFLLAGYQGDEDKKLAISYYNKALEMDAKHFDALAGKANCLALGYGEGRIDVALEIWLPLYERIVGKTECDKEYSMCQALLPKILKGFLKTKDSKVLCAEWVESIMEKVSGNASLLTHIGVLYLHGMFGDTEKGKAYAYFNQAVEADGQHWPALRDLAYCLVQRVGVPASMSALQCNLRAIECLAVAVKGQMGNETRVQLRERLLCAYVDVLQMEGLDVEKNKSLELGLWHLGGIIRQLFHLESADERSKRMYGIASCELGRMALKSVDPARSKNGVKYLQEATEVLPTHTKAHILLSLAYLHGLGGAEKNPTAVLRHAINGCVAEVEPGDAHVNLFQLIGCIFNEAMKAGTPEMCTNAMSAIATEFGEDHQYVDYLHGFMNVAVLLGQQGRLPKQAEITAFFKVKAIFKAAGVDTPKLLPKFADIAIKLIAANLEVTVDNVQAQLDE